MSGTKMEKEANVIEVRKEYDRFQETKRQIKDEIRLRVEREAEAAIADLEVGFAKYLHEKHDGGMSWRSLSTACRKYGNGGEFKRLREPYTPENPAANLVAQAMKAREEKERAWKWLDETTLEVTIEDETYLVTEVYERTQMIGEGEEAVEDRWPEFEIPYGQMDNYSLFAHAVDEALEERRDHE